MINSLFDSHLHLKFSGSAEKSIMNLLRTCELNNVSGGFIIHMDSDDSEIPLSKLLSSLKGKDNFLVFKNFKFKEKKRTVAKIVEEYYQSGIFGLKIHPRQQGLNLKSKYVCQLIEIAQEFEMPINICSFDDGSWGRIDLTTSQFLWLADQFPKTKFIWSHAGGHHVLDFLMMARRTRNVFLDTSFTQSYFRQSTVKQNLNYAIESLPDRYIFGTDFESSDYGSSLRDLYEFYKVENSNCERLFKSNFLDFVSLKC